MRPYDPFDNRQAKTAAAPFRSCTSWISAVKTLKNVWKMLSCNANTSILDRKQCLLFVGLHTQKDETTCIGIAYGIVHKVHDHLNQVAFIPQHGNGFKCIYTQGNAMSRR